MAGQQKGLAHCRYINEHVMKLFMANHTNISWKECVRMTLRWHRANLEREMKKRQEIIRIQLPNRPALPGQPQQQQQQRLTDRHLMQQRIGGGDRPLICGGWEEHV